MNRNRITQVYSFLLSFGEKVTILKPESLRRTRMVFTELNQMDV